MHMAGTWVLHSAIARIYVRGPCPLTLCACVQFFARSEHHSRKSWIHHCYVYVCSMVHVHDTYNHCRTFLLLDLMRCRNLMPDLKVILANIKWCKRKARQRRPNMYMYTYTVYPSKGTLVFFNGVLFSCMVGSEERRETRE